MSRPKKVLKKPTPKEKVPPQDLLERFHEKKVCDILPTNPEKKPDIFDEYRPKSHRECMTYNISQTDTKMDAGPTKIHVQQTRAEYEPYPDGYVFEEDVPPPPPKRKKRPSHGRGPVWLFLDEELKRKIDFEQEIYKREMEARLKRKIKALREMQNYHHEEMLKRVGLDWYQELSPNQLSTVDNLADSIKKDVMKNTLINTQACLAHLGLVLRPNHKHVEIALKNCCGNPVEFLLILYQLINPNRKSYSINDRLILSAVVHLSMRSVLRELHIRIPSPPAAPKRAKKKKISKKPYVKYISPYVVPFTFEPEAPKHTGIYKNCHIQYPESPYFSYLDELRQEMVKCLLEESNQEEEGVSYHKKFRVSDRPAQLSEVESIMTTLDREIDEELVAAQKKYDSLAVNRRARRLLRPSVYRPCEKSTGILDSQKGTLINYPEQYCKCCGGETSVSLTMELCITDEFVEDDRESGTKYQCMVNVDEKPKKSSNLINNTTEKEGKAILATGGVMSKELACKCAGKKKAATSKRKSENIKGDSFDDDEDKEMEKVEKEIEEKLKHDEEKCTCTPGLSDHSSSSTLSIDTVGTFVKNPLEEPDEQDKGEKLLEVKKPKPFVCGCKAMVDIALECAQRKVECVEACDKKKKPTLIVADTKLTEDEEPIPIIAGVKPEEKCKCLEKYRRTIDKLEELRTKQEVQDTLKSVKKKFLISGVTTGPDGKPVYVLSGTSEERPCKKCEEIQEWKKRKEERLANMPDSSHISQKYVIGGVHHSPVGNVYVIAGVLPAKECECMRLYNAYMEKHSPCMDIYERYVQKMKKEAEEYMSEITGDEKEHSAENKDSSSSVKNSAESEIAGELTSAHSDSAASNDSLEGLEGACFECNQHLFESDESNVDSEAFVTIECKSKSCKNKKQFLRYETEEDDADVDIKRFIVLDKIPCVRGEQLAIIKKALRSMARDGFPLAKLPQAYKLPHFKLWMALRCGKYWTMEDRVRMYFMSKSHWHHLDKCNTYVNSPRLKMSNERAWKYTWASAKYVKKITDDLKERFCRKAKQGIVNDGREFFPSMFDYELPTKAFRDCYFAYVPGKEESVFSNRPWKVFEYIDYKLIRIKKAKEKCLK